MPDIFDEAAGTSQKPDIFDQVAAPASAPAPDIFDQVAPEPAPATPSEPSAPSRIPKPSDAESSMLADTVKQIYQPEIEDVKDVLQHPIALAAAGPYALPGTVLSGIMARAIKWSGNVSKGVFNDIASHVAGDQSQEGENFRAALAGQNQPYDFSSQEMTPTQQVFTHLGQGLAEALPQIAVQSGAAGAAKLVLKGTELAPATAEWLAQSVGSAVGFGAGEKNYDPMQAAVAFAFPSVGALGEKAAVSILGKLGVEIGSPLVKQIIEKIGSLGTFELFQDLPKVPYYLDPKVPMQDKMKSFAEGAVMNIAFHLGSIPQLTAMGISEVKLKNAAEEVAQQQFDQMMDKDLPAWRKYMAERDNKSPQLTDDEFWNLTNNGRRPEPTVGNPMITPEGGVVSARRPVPQPRQPSVEPTAAEKKTGVYPKETVDVDGIKVAIENTSGSIRSGSDAGGNKWQVRMPADYGEIVGSKGADGDKVDAYLGRTPNDTVFVIDQKDPKTGVFDEHKTFLNFGSQQEAVDTYNRAFSDGSGPARNGGVTEMTKDQFKDWVKSKRAKQPLVTKPPVSETPPAVNGTEAVNGETKAAIPATKPVESATPNVVDLIDFDGRALSEKTAGKDKTAFFEVKDPEDPALPKQLVTDSSPAVKTLGQSGKNEGKMVAALSKNNTHRVTFFEHQGTGEVIGLPTWKNSKGEVMVSKPGSKRAQKYPALIEDGNQVPIASVRVATPLHSADPAAVFRFADAKDFENQVLKPAKERVAATARSGAAAEDAMVDQAHTDDGETLEFSGTHVDENLDREVHEAIVDMLPRGKDGKVLTNLTPKELQETILTTLEEPENKSLLHHVYYEALAELSNEADFQRMTPKEKEAEIIKQITAKFYDKYKTGGFEKDYAGPESGALEQAAGERAKDKAAGATQAAEAARSATNGSTDTGQAAEHRATATGGPVLPAEPAEGAGAGHVLSTEPPAQVAAHSVEFTIGNRDYEILSHPETSPFSNDFASPEVADLRLGQVESGRDVLAAIYPHLEVPAFHRLAERLSNLVGDVEIHFVNRIGVTRDGVKQFARGIYNAKENRIYISLSAMHDMAGFSGTVMHELVHAATEYGLHHGAAEGVDAEEFARQQSALQFDLEYILREVRTVAEKRGLNFYGLTSISELVAEGMSDKLFQHFLNSVEIKGIEPRKISALGRMWDAITKFLGFKAKDSSALEHLVGAVEEATDLTQTAQYSPGGKESLEILPSLARDTEEANRLFENENWLEKQDKVTIARMVQNQNSWVNLPIFETLPAAVRDNLPFLKDRKDALEWSVAQHGEHRSTLEQILNSPLPMETKKAIAGDMLNNMLDAEMQLSSSSAKAKGEIKDIGKEIIKTLSAPADVLNPQRFVERSVVKVLTRAQAATMRMQGVDADIITARVKELEGMKKEGSEVLERVFRAMSRGVSEERLADPETSPEEILNTVNLNEETLGVNVSPDMIHLAREVFGSDRQLPERLRAFVQLDTAPLERQNLARAMAELKDALVKDDHQEWLDANPDLARKLLFIVPELRSKLGRMNDWAKTTAAISGIGNDLPWKQAREEVYKMFGMEGFTHTYDGDSRITFNNPLHGTKVELDVSLSGMAGKENADKLQALFDDAAEYVKHPEAEGYDPKTAIAWRALLENSDYWLNQSWNTLAPRYVPTKFSVFGLLSDLFADPMKLMATLAGREANELMVKHQAYSLAREQLRNVEHRLGYKAQKLAQDAARAHGLSLEDWRYKVANEIIAASQQAGQIPLREGSQVNGVVVRESDMAAIRSAKEYQDAVRAIAEAGDGSSAMKVNPSRIKTEQGFRRAVPTSPFENTQPGKMDMRRAELWYDQWSKLKTNGDRIKWLEQPDNMRDVLMAHLRWQTTPGYVGHSIFKPAYVELAREWNNGAKFTFQDIVDRAFERQTEEGEPMLEEEIPGKILREVDNLFRRVKSRLDEVAREKAGDKISMFSTTNSFTSPRSDVSLFPPSFMQWGAITYPERIGMTNDALKFYANEMIGKGGALERLQHAFQNKSAEYERRLKAAVESGRSAKSEKAAIEQDVVAGKEFYDYAQLQTAISRVDRIAREENRILDKDAAGGSGLSNGYRRVTNSMMGQILMSAGARLRHTFGNWQNWYMHMERLHGAFGAGVRMPGHILRNMVDVPVSMMAEYGLFSGKDINEIRGVGSSFVKAVVERRNELNRMRELGFADASNLRERMVAWREAMKNIGGDRSGLTSLGERLRKAGGSSIDLMNQFVSQLPINARFNDMVLNLEASNSRIDMERWLQANALEFFAEREKLNPASYHDLSDPANRLSPQELIGREGATGRHAAELRNLFSSQGIDIDARMLDYYKHYQAAKEAGAKQADLDQIDLLNAGQKASTDWQILQSTGKSSYANRPYAFRGSPMRNAAGLLFGLPMWSLGRFEGAFRKMNYQSKGRYLWETLPIAVGLLGYGAVMGIARQELDRKMKKVLYGEESSNPGLSNVRSVGDFAKLATRAWASLFPIIGDAVNSLMNTPDRFGNLDSAFVSLNFALDIVKMGVRMYQTRDMVTPVENFLKRWSPPAHILINATTQTGLVQLHNAYNIIRAATPDTIDSRRRGSSGTFAGSPTTPMIQAMKEAAFDGNHQAFMDAYKKAVEEKKSEGIQKPELAVAASFAAGNPWSVNLGRLPTEAERQLILSRMDPDQRAAVLAAESTYQKFGEAIGARVNLTQEDLSSSGSTAGTARAQSVGFPVSGSGQRQSSAQSTGSSRLSSFSARVPAVGSSGGSVGASVSGGGLPRSRSRVGSRLRGVRLSRGHRSLRSRTTKLRAVATHVIRHHVA